MPCKEGDMTNVLIYGVQSLGDAVETNKPSCQSFNVADHRHFIPAVGQVQGKGGLEQNDGNGGLWGQSDV